MRWFFTQHLHIVKFSIFKTDEYGENQGYKTKKEAVDAALASVDKDISNFYEKMEKISSDLSFTSDHISKLLKARKELTSISESE